MRVLYVHWYQKTKAHVFLVILIVGKLIPVMRILLWVRLGSASSSWNFGSWLARQQDQNSAGPDMHICMKPSTKPEICQPDVYWTVHHCDNWRIKNQLDATYYFIVLLICSTCFGHYYAHHQELATMMLSTTLVVSVLVCCILEVRCS
jgi:hypothetical protein